MSFIPKREAKTGEKAVALRRELITFLAPVTVWAVMLNVFGNSLYALIEMHWGAWARAHVPVAFLLGSASLVALAYLGMIFLGMGMTGAMREVRRFPIVLPVITGAHDIQYGEIEGYRISAAVERRAGRLENELFQSYRDAAEKAPSRPFVERFYQLIEEGLSTQLLDDIGKCCEFFLGRSADFHGVDFSGLSRDGGPCARRGVAGAPEKQIHLPDGCQASFESLFPDHYGKVAHAITVRGPFGQMRFSYRPQWPLLSDGYHGLSLRLVKSRLPAGCFVSERDVNRPPSLWVLEIPVEVDVHFRNPFRPWVFLTPRFELLASWIGETIDSLETRWSWERFVDRGEAAEDKGATA